MSRHKIPCPGEIPAAWEATPVAKGLTVEANTPTVVPIKITPTATKLSKPILYMTGKSKG